MWVRVESIDEGDWYASGMPDELRNSDIILDFVIRPNWEGDMKYIFLMEACGYVLRGNIVGKIATTSRQSSDRNGFCFWCNGLDIRSSGISNVFLAFETQARTAEGLH